MLWHSAFLKTTDRFVNKIEGIIEKRNLSFFNLGTGYNLSVVREPQNTYKHQEVESIIKNYVPNAYLKCENGDMLIYLLPDESKSYFCELLANLENNKETLGISSISISVTTLEDVFLKVGAAAQRDKNSRNLETRISVTDCKLGFLFSFIGL